MLVVHRSCDNCTAQLDIPAQGAYHYLHLAYSSRDSMGLNIIPPMADKLDFCDISCLYQYLSNRRKT